MQRRYYKALEYSKRICQPVCVRMPANVQFHPCNNKLLHTTQEAILFYEHSLFFGIFKVSLHNKNK